MFAKDCFLVALILCFACCTCEVTKKESKNEILERHKRVIPWLQTAGCGFKGKRSVDNMPLSVPSSNQIQPTPMRSNTKTNKLFTRTRAYSAIKRNLSKLGYNGTSCLLKIICETAEVPVNPNNGILGSIFHVVFTPSSSEDEGLPNDFYEAENSGALGDCSAYNSHCPSNMLDTVSKTMFLK